MGVSSAGWRATSVRAEMHHGLLLGGRHSTGERTHRQLSYLVRSLRGTRFEARARPRAGIRSNPCDLRQLRAGVPGRLRLLPGVLGAAGSSRPPGGPQDRDRGLLRRDRLDRDGRAPRSRVAPPGDVALLRRDAGGAGAPRRNRREVHRGRGDGGVRGSGDPRGRCPPGGSRRGRDARCPPRSSTRSWSATTASPSPPGSV